MKNPAVLQAFGQHLRQLREQRGWSQQALADGRIFHISKLRPKSATSTL